MCLPWTSLTGRFSCKVGASVSTIIGKTAIAPCGHTGEVIVGTYVKCSQGCEGPAIIPNRGEPGHVINCACKPCKIRRKTAFIVLRDKGGKDWAKLEWDGVTDVLSSATPKSGDLRHFKFIDTDGKVIGTGNLNAFIGIGEFKVHARKMLDALMTCSVAKDVVTPKGLRHYDPNKVVITFRGIPLIPYP